MNQNLHVNKTNFHIKGFALRLALKQRRKVTIAGYCIINTELWQTTFAHLLILVAKKKLYISTHKGLGIDSCIFTLLTGPWFLPVRLNKLQLQPPIKVTTFEFNHRDQLGQWKLHYQCLIQALMILLFLVNNLGVPQYSTKLKAKTMRY